MENKINVIFDFLKKNRKYNHKLQEKYHLSTILPYKNKEEKILSLLYDIVNTQSQPKIDNISNFFQDINGNIDRLETFEKFVTYLNGDNCIINYKSLFDGLKKCSGWGNKTSALFVKNIFHFHNGKYSDELFIWDDAPNEISNDDSFYLPVDAVIISIFNEIDKSKNWNFNNINLEIKKKYSGNDIEVWDDLWFWGFITQKGSGIDRIFEWNENKYWILKETSKEKEEIKIIEEKSKIFLEIINR